MDAADSDEIWPTETIQRIAKFAIETAGACAGLAGDVNLEGETANVVGSWHKARPATTNGSNNEIQRNILARQVLRLPAR